MTNVQFGVRRTWPDGYVEDTLSEDRTDAELIIRQVNNNPDNPATATLLRRTVGDWAEAATLAQTTEPEVKP